MGGFGIVGLWLWLGLALVASILIAVGSVWLADRTLGLALASPVSPSGTTPPTTPSRPLVARAETENRPSP